MSHALTLSPARPLILCTLCQHLRCRAVQASHHYTGERGTRVYCCPTCAAQVQRLAVAFPKAIPEPAPFKVQGSMFNVQC